jgi:hypothetical protein
MENEKGFAFTEFQAVPAEVTLRWLGQLFAD